MTAATAPITDTDPADLTTETLTAEVLRLHAEADRAHAAGLTPGLPTFRPDSSLYSGCGALGGAAALSYAEHVNRQANTLALLALAVS
jgi:hypothetical protein